MELPERKYFIQTAKSSLWLKYNFTEDLFDAIIKEVGNDLEFEPPIVVYGKKCNQRRNIGFYSDTSIGYAYSNQLMKSKPLKDKPVIKSVMDKVNKELDTNFNGILVNLYNDGTKNIGAHSDSEVGLDKKKGTVAGISYGAERTFRIRCKESGKIVVDVSTRSGALLVMDGNFQKEFKHEIPIEKHITEPRISLTFRHHVK